MRRRSRRLAVITWFGGLALIVQAMLPMFLALEFRLAAADAPYLMATDDAICGPGQGGVPGADRHHHHLAACPICLTLAAAQAFTTPAELGLPLPAGPAARPVDGRIATLARAAADPRPYQARAPPETI